MSRIRKRKVRSSDSLTRRNIRFAKATWPSEISSLMLCELRTLSLKSGMDLALGEILLLNGRWYVTSAGLLHIAKDRRCRGIHTRAIEKLSNPSSHSWVFRATVYKTSQSKGFVSYGDADPSNTSPLVRGAEMRVAETRAVNRALRKAYGIGLCSVEELGLQPFPVEPPNGNGSSNGQPRLRDKLCLLIRNYELDPTLVKRYAADFCGTETLREASRDLVAAFVSTISQEAANNRDALVCKLNSYNQPEEVRP